MLAHNGNLVNAAELREELENEGAIFSTGNDTEIFMHLLVRALRRNSLPEAIREACSRVRGAYCLLVLAGSTLIAVRDPFGFHPLALVVWTASPSSRRKPAPLSAGSRLRTLGGTQAKWSL